MQDGKLRKQDAREWVKGDNGKPLARDWVFAGSQLYDDPFTKKKRYAADDGDLITVANFASAILDLPIESSANDADRAFMTNTARDPGGWHRGSGCPLSPAGEASGKATRQGAANPMNSAGGMGSRSPRDPCNAELQPGRCAIIRCRRRTPDSARMILGISRTARPAWPTLPESRPEGSPDIR